MKQKETEIDFDKEAQDLSDKLKKIAVRIEKEYPKKCDSVKKDPEKEQLEKIFQDLINEIQYRIRILFGKYNEIYHFIHDGRGLDIEPFEIDYIKKDADFLVDIDFSAGIDFWDEMYWPSREILKKIDEEIEKFYSKLEKVYEVVSAIVRQEPKQKKDELKKQIRELAEIVVDVVPLFIWTNVKLLKCLEFCDASYLSTEAIKKALEDRGYKVSN